MSGGPGRWSGRRWGVLLGTRVGFLAGIGAVGSCASSVVDEYETCVLDLVPAASEGAPGDEITLTGGPQSEARDTRVEVGGVRAEVRTVSRVDCDACDLCRDDAGCAACGLCSGIGLEPDYRKECFGDPLADPAVDGVCGTCVETLTFAVPVVPAGLTSVLVVNRNGQSEAIPFTVLPGPATTGATGDTGAGATGDTAGDTSDTGAAR